MSEVAARFALDEDTARAWLAAGVEADGDFLAHLDADNTLPEITADWAAHLDDVADIIGMLGQARGNGIITAVPHVHIGLDVDGAQEGYRWLIDIFHGSEAHLTLASPFTSGDLVAPGSALGVDAGLAVLREAVASANECLDNLTAYMAAASPIAELVASLPRGEWGSDELGTLANWLGEHGYDIGDEDSNPDDVATGPARSRPCPACGGTGSAHANACDPD
jgi:hypothetical protein